MNFAVYSVCQQMFFSAQTKGAFKLCFNVNFYAGKEHSDGCSGRGSSYERAVTTLLYGQVMELLDTHWGWNLCSGKCCRQKSRLHGCCSQSVVRQDCGCHHCKSSQWRYLQFLESHFKREIRSVMPNCNLKLKTTGAIPG